MACANAGTSHSNGSQFFITLDRCDWLDKKNTIFGKVMWSSSRLESFFQCMSWYSVPFLWNYRGWLHVFLQVTGDSIFNLLSLADVETDKDDRPVYVQKILSVEVPIMKCHILCLFQIMIVTHILLG